MILIADCGSTKIDWCFVENSKVVKTIKTCGINALMLTQEEIAERLQTQLAPELGEYRRVDAVYFYGAGCISPDVCDNMRQAIATVIEAKEIHVATDLLAAARALCGREPGIACIMGTGSNSCYYDGQEIRDNVSPLGYILGDEGSGAVLGKILVGDVLKHQLPEHLCQAFLDEYHLDRLAIIKRVYKEPQANRFLASLTPFLAKYIHEPAIHDLVLRSFKSFFVRNIHAYEGYRELPVNFIGSIAYYYEKVLREAAEATGCHIGTILKVPMPGLIAFHSL